MIQVTSPHREDAKLESTVAEIGSRINRLYGSLEHYPVHHYCQRLDRHEYYALLRLADVGFITSVREGMNLTSHEFVVCQQEKHAPLVLSEFTGTAGSFSAALQVNPWDYLNVAHALNDALLMSPDEKQHKHEQLYQFVVRHSAQFWAQSFITEIRSPKLRRNLSADTPPLSLTSVVSAFRSAKRRLLLLDYDVSRQSVKPAHSLGYLDANS